MQVARENTAIANVNIAGTHCAAVVFVIHALIDRHAFGITATRQDKRKARCADSESRFLAMKKFSCSPASRLIAARQNRIFARIAAADSQPGFFAARGASSLMVNN
jgi:hypothetical protein